MPVYFPKSTLETLCSGCGGSPDSKTRPLTLKKINELKLSFKFEIFVPYLLRAKNAPSRKAGQFDERTYYR